MDSETSDTQTMHIEIDSEAFDRVHELALRQLMHLATADDCTTADLREYGQAYDEFVQAAGAAQTIGDQPDEIRELWHEYVDAVATRIADGGEDDE